MTLIIANAPTAPTLSFKICQIRGGGCGGSKGVGQVNHQIPYLLLPRGSLLGKHRCHEDVSARPRLANPSAADHLGREPSLYSWGNACENQPRMCPDGATRLWASLSDMEGETRGEFSAAELEAAPSCLVATPGRWCQRIHLPFR